tara:strand:+ start:157 stop:375 length:219 start_codon:yes stop_codon:yes gene_type:complete
MIAGIIKLIIHNINVDDKIPTTLLENIPKTNKATEPLTPISAIAMVGVNVIRRNTNITANIDSFKSICTSNT